MSRLPLVPLPSRIAAIERAYGAAQRRIYAALARVTPDNYTDALAGSTRREIERIVLTLNARVRSWARPAIAAAYGESAGVARTRLEMLGLDPVVGPKAAKRRDQRKIDALARVMVNDYAKANRTILKTAARYLALVAHASRRVEQLQAFDSADVKDWINRTVRRAVKAVSKYNEGTAHLTSKNIAAKVRAKLLEKIGGGDFIRINNKNYNLKKYSELVARTRMRESQTEAVKELNRQFDNDLVFIPPHDNPCEEICKPYQGKVFSVSGNHPKYPLLPDGGPPWHPRCEDSANPITEAAIAAR